MTVFCMFLLFLYVVLCFLMSFLFYCLMYFLFYCLAYLPRDYRCILANCYNPVHYIFPCFI
uniref:Uncharacterized protein n=1 Tax=Anguilla anguilla TaxID=7936 RepID=A0A0E9XXJ0_ANGAN